MKKINLKGITESLSDNEMKKVKGGLSGYESKVPLDGKEYDNGGGSTGPDCCNNSCTSDKDCCSQCKRCTSVAGGGFGTFCSN